MNLKHLALASILACLPGLSPQAHAARTAIVIENVHVFDGMSSARASVPANVLIVDSLIQAISTDTLSPPTETSVTRIDGGGRTLMPGLIAPLNSHASTR